MTVVGNAEQWHDLLASLVPDIVKLINEAWATMPPIPPDAKEDPVSEALCRRLRAMRTLSDLPLQVHTQLVELDSEADVDQGRIDIVFVPLIATESIYFALECKRINVLQADGSIRRYFSEYVVHGLTRFVSGQYSSSVCHGGMLAFVLDGDVDAALTGVVSNIVDKRDVLGLKDAEIQHSRFAPSNDNMRETNHERSSPMNDVLVQHFFMTTASSPVATT